MTSSRPPEKPQLKVLLCSPRGFCAGVVRAIDTVERALAIYGKPVYVRHEIVHNRYVVESLRQKGAVFVEELDEIPDTDVPVIFSAHGVPKSVPVEAVKRVAPVVDAMIVVGSPNSSNSQRLKEVALRNGCPHAELLQRAEDINWDKFGAIGRLGLTAGASAPEVLIEEIIDAFAARYDVSVETVSAVEESGIFFPLPRQVRSSGEAAE